MGTCQVTGILAPDAILTDTGSAGKLIVRNSVGDSSLGPTLATASRKPFATCSWVKICVCGGVVGCEAKGVCGALVTRGEAAAAKPGVALSRVQFPSSSEAVSCASSTTKRH